jgi:hypothetical protein
LGQIRRRLFGLCLEETSYARRGFRGATDLMRKRLESIGSTFLGGYHVALEAGTPESVGNTLGAVALEMRGFAFEGAAMGFALLDRLTPWPANRLARFLAGAGDPHTYMVHVGLGWLWARVSLGSERAFRRLDPVLGWLAFDGWGFHEGFFHWPKYIEAQPPPSRVRGYAKRVFDQGLGRSFWFVNGGDPNLISQVIQGFPADRQSDLWSGIGLAATYAGFLDQPGLELLREKAGPHQACLAQGSAFASKARERAGNLTDYTDQAAQALCGMSGREAARLCDSTLENLPANEALDEPRGASAKASSPQPSPPEEEREKRDALNNSLPGYEVWRRRLQRHLQQVQRPSARLQEACP